MSDDGAGGGSLRALRCGAEVTLGCAGMTAWVQMTTAAGNGWSIEPNSDAAITAAAAARGTGIAWAVAVVAAAGALAAVTGRRWLAVLALPGVVVAMLLLLAPGANGGAFFYGLLTSVVAVGVTAHLGVGHRRGMREHAPGRTDPH